MSITTDVWTAGSYADTAQPLPDAAPAIPAYAPVEQVTDEHLTALVQSLAVTADNAGLKAAWHVQAPVGFTERFFTSIRLRNGRVMDIHPTVSPNGQVRFRCAHWTAENIWLGDAHTVYADSVADVLAIARDWDEAPPA